MVNPYPKKSTFNRLMEVLQPIYKESESLRTDYEIELLREIEATEC